MFDNLNLVAEASDCRAKRAKVMRRDRDVSASSPTAAFLALLAK